MRGVASTGQRLGTRGWLYLLLQSTQGVQHGADTAVCKTVGPPGSTQSWSTGVANEAGTPA
eukprot:7934507-Prorocentrum_lima.AAC.1